MVKPERIAFEATKEIVIAKMTSSSISPSTDGGEKVGDFFKGIYDKILEITKELEN